MPLNNCRSSTRVCEACHGSWGRRAVAALSVCRSAQKDCSSVGLLAEPEAYRSQIINPEELSANIVNPKSVAANPSVFKQGMTIQDLIGWSAWKMGDGSRLSGTGQTESEKERDDGAAATRKRLGDITLKSLSRNCSMRASPHRPEDGRHVQIRCARLRGLLWFPLAQDANSLVPHQGDLPWRPWSVWFCLIVNGIASRPISLVPHLFRPDGRVEG